MVIKTSVEKVERGDRRERWKIPTYKWLREYELSPQDGADIPIFWAPQTLSLFTHSFSRTWRGERERRADPGRGCRGERRRENSPITSTTRVSDPYLNANLIYNLYIILCIIFSSNKIPLYNKEIWHLPGNLEFIIARTGHVTLRPTHPPSLPPLCPLLSDAPSYYAAYRGEAKWHRAQRLCARSIECPVGTSGGMCHVIQDQ